MMLTWKIFMTIMSMVSVTLQMEISGAGSSSDPSQFCIYDKDTQRYYPAIYNDYNYFLPGSVANSCFAIVRLFCQTRNENVTSNDCAKKGMIFYRIIPGRPLLFVDEFFQEFPLVPGNFKLPVAFCNEKGDEAQKCINVLHEYRDLVQGPRREDIVILDDPQEKRDDLQQHLAVVRRLKQEEPVTSAEIKSRKVIANFAFFHKDIFELHEENFERKYLEHISEHVSSKDSMNQNIIYYDK